MTTTKHTDLRSYALEIALKKFAAAAYANLDTLIKSGALSGQEEPNQLARIVTGITGANTLAGLKQNPATAKEIANIQHFI